MPVDTLPALPLQAAVQAREDSAAATPPTLALESHGYSYQIIGEYSIAAEQLRQVLAESSDPSTALLGINLALSNYDERAEILQRSGNTVVFRISARLRPKLQGAEGVDLAYSPMLPEESVTNLSISGPRKKVQTQQALHAAQTVQDAAAAPIVTTDSHGYIYEIVGQPLITADKLQRILAEATEPSDAILRLNKAIAEAGLAFAGGRAEYSGVSIYRFQLLQWVAAFEAGAQLEPFVQDTNDVKLELSPALGETMLAQVYAARDRERKTVRIRLLKQPVAALDAPEPLKPFFHDVTDVNLTLSALLDDEALASAYSARQGARPQINYTAIPGSEAVRMSVEEQPIRGAKPWNASVSLGNLGNRYAGRWQAGTSVAYRPGHGSEITVNYTQGVPSLDSSSKGSRYKNGGAGISAVTPWGIYGLNYSQTDYLAASSAALIPFYDANGNLLQVLPGETQERGAVKSLALSGEQILHSTENTRWTANEGLAHVDDVASIDALYQGTFLQNFPLHDETFNFLSAGVSVNSRTDVMGRAAALTGSFKLAKGLSGKVGSFPYSAAHLADPEFLLVQGGLGYDQTLPGELKFGVTFSTQWTSDILPQSRQLVVGGFGTLTAWLPGIASGDRGGQFRATLNSPAIKDGAGTFSVSLFYEAGRVTTLNAGNVSPTQSLGDIGLALVGDTPNLQYVFGYAHPLTADNTDETTQSLLRAHTFFNLTGKW